MLSVAGLTMLAAIAWQSPRTPARNEPGAGPAVAENRKAAALASATQALELLERLEDRDVAARTAITLAADVCRYDRTQGRAFFLRAHRFVQTLKESPRRTSLLAALATRGAACDPALAGLLKFEDAPAEVRAQADLRAALESLRDASPEVPDLLRAVADGFGDLSRESRLTLIENLQRLQRISAEQADAAFLRAAERLRPDGPETVASLYALGNVFTAAGADPGAVIAYPLQSGQTAYAFSELRPGMSAAVAAGFLRIAAQQLALQQAASAEQTLRQALANQLLPLAERHLPAAAADLRVAAGYQGGNGPTAEARAPLNKMNPRLDQLDADLEARADAEADSVTKDVRRMHLIAYLLQSNRSKAARGHLPKINDPELRSALETLTVYKSGEEQLDAGAALVTEAPRGLFASLLCLAAAAKPAEGSAARATQCLDPIRRADAEFRAPLMAGAASLLAREEREFALEVLRQGIAEANAFRDQPRPPAKSTPVLSLVVEPRGATARLRFGDSNRFLRLQPRGLPPLSFVEAVRALPEPDTAVLWELAGAWQDESERAKLLAGIAALAMARAFGPEGGVRR